MTKEPISLRLDNDLLERARRLCEREKTTLTQMVTDVLLAHIQKREYEIEHLSHSPCDIEEPTPDEIDSILGVDLGIANIASDSDGAHHSGEQVEHTR